MHNLSERLSLIARFVKSGSSVCDVGTDHGYLPAFLSVSGRCKNIVATDIKQKPLKNAEDNLKRLGVDNVQLLLCDGLEKVTRDMADTVIIAGMGGEVISGIIDRADFLRDDTVTLILQPMTAAVDLRKYLAAGGFTVEREEAVAENGKVYSVMQARFNRQPYDIDDLQTVIGKLLPDTDASREYISKQYRIATKCISQLENVTSKHSECIRYKSLAERLKNILEEENGI